jgi:hypothetical protein
MFQRVPREKDSRKWVWETLLISMLKKDAASPMSWPRFSHPIDPQRPKNPCILTIKGAIRESAGPDLAEAPRDLSKHF